MEEGVGGGRRMEEGVGGGRPQDEGEGVSVHVGESAGRAKEGCAAVEQADVFAEGREEGKGAGGRIGLALGVLRQSLIG